VAAGGRACTVLTSDPPPRPALRGGPRPAARAVLTRARRVVSLAPRRTPALAAASAAQVFGIAALQRARGESTFLPLSLSRPLRKAMLGLPIVADDVKRLDPTYYANRMEVGRTTAR
jgi:hypothetical protein